MESLKKPYQNQNKKKINLSVHLFDGKSHITTVGI